MCVVCGDTEELSGAFPLEHPREAHQSLVSGSAEDRSTAHLPPTLHPSLANPGTAGRVALCPRGLSAVLNSGLSPGKPPHPPWCCRPQSTSGAGPNAFLVSVLILGSGPKAHDCTEI